MAATYSMNEAVQRLKSAGLRRYLTEFNNLAALGPDGRAWILYQHREAGFSRTRRRDGSRTGRFYSDQVDEIVMQARERHERKQM